MKTPRRKIATYIATQTMNGTFDARKVDSVAALLLEENRTSEIDSILRDVLQEWATRGQVVVLAKSAHELTDAVIADIKAEVARMYPEANILITHELDPKIVGGIKLEFASHRLDLSVAGEIQKFKLLAVHGKE